MRTTPQNLPIAADIAPEGPPPVRICRIATDRFVITGGRATGMTVEFLRGDDGDIEWARLGGRIARRVAR